MTCREALGRSRGGLSTKLHLVADRRCRPIARILTPGQWGDSLQFVPLLEFIRVRRRGVGRPRKRPARVLADKAHSSRRNRRNRRYLRRHDVKAVIPVKKDQAAHRRNRGSQGGRPQVFDRDAYKDRNTVERCVCATRRLVVSPAQPGGIGGIFLGLMAHLDPKGDGDQSMPENQRPGSVARDGALRGPRDKAKAGLPEPQSPVDESSHPSERLLKPMPCPVTALMHGRHTFRDMGRCPVRTLKEMSGAPTSRYDVQQGRTWDRLRGANPKVTECP
ncbi:MULTISPECIES: transposase [unclassified Streptomyces]|uniref:transposase n=1 Tax=unclassified Streptomyces TaxID=2593676 RepID=UPI001BE74FD6|nr:transposase [Streptomyces sp. ISL-21]MBT2608115.1 transposase [Streptomyces sp. ISL-87]